MGVMIRPAEARAMAPVVRLARLLSRGRALEADSCVERVDECVAFGGLVEGERTGTGMEARRFERATFWRRALRVEK